MSLDRRPGQQGDGFPPAHGGYPDAKPAVTAQLPPACTGRITGRGEAGGIVIGHDGPCPVHDAQRRPYPVFGPRL